MSTCFGGHIPYGNRFLGHFEPKSAGFCISVPVLGDTSPPLPPFLYILGGFLHVSQRVFVRHLLAKIGHWLG
jgi:hypothetical protein